MTANEINRYKAETERMHYERSDPETERHNKATEYIGIESNAISDWWNKSNAAHLERQDAINLGHYERLDSETKRHNLVQEDISAGELGIKNIMMPYQVKVLQSEESRNLGQGAKAFAERDLAEEKVDESKSKQVLNLIMAGKSGVDSAMSIDRWWTSLFSDD